MFNLKSVAGIVVTSLGALAVAVPTARAVVLDSTNISISVPNAALSGSTGPYANLHIAAPSPSCASATATER